MLRCILNPLATSRSAVENLEKECGTYAQNELRMGLVLGKTAEVDSHGDAREHVPYDCGVATSRGSTDAVGDKCRTLRNTAESARMAVGSDHKTDDPVDTMYPSGKDIGKGKHKDLNGRRAICQRQRQRKTQIFERAGARR
eukprot:3148693-Amphidinium_carterae.2